MVGFLNRTKRILQQLHIIPVKWMLHFFLLLMIGRYTISRININFMCHHSQVNKHKKQLTSLTKMRVSDPCVKLRLKLKAMHSV